MSGHHFWLSDAQLARIQPLLPNKERSVRRVDDREVISGIVHVIRSGLMWRDAPACYGPHKTLYNRFVRWSKACVFDCIFQALAAESAATGTVMIDTTHLKAHRTAASLLKKGPFRAVSGGPEAASTPSFTRSADGDGRPVRLLLTEGQINDYRGAEILFPGLPDAETLIADKGYDRDRVRDALAARKITPCIPGRANRKKPVAYDTEIYKQRNLIERMFGRLKDRRRIATRYDQCAHPFFCEICIAAIVIFWI